MSEVKYKIKEAARLLDRSPHTLRSWDKHEDFPEEFKPERDERNERLYSPELIEKIRDFLATSDFRPGRGVPNYKPDAEARKAHIENMRASMQKRGPMKALVSGTEGNVLAFLELVGQATVPQLSAQLGIRRGVLDPMVQSLVADGHLAVDDEGIVRPTSE